MDRGVISVRYARALLESATAQKVEDAVYQDMMTLYESYLQVKALRPTIDNPMLRKDQKQHVLETAMGNPVDLSKRFVALVLKEDRESILQFMAASYVSLYRKQKNIIRGHLTTAVAVDEATEAKLRQMVESRAKGSVEFTTEVDPSIIGGFILEYDTYRMDASVKTKLRDILKTIKQK
ncbi:MAG: F0F1 ATP synthase subunit delta [Prevotellaceae bacterium]|nr:F0F1 ATP synthase subunit delta [Prevotellaceae bacterium]